MSDYRDIADERARPPARPPKRPAGDAPEGQPASKRSRTTATANRLRKLVAKVNGLLKVKHARADLVDYQTMLRPLATAVVERGQEAADALDGDATLDVALYAPVEEQLIETAAMLPPRDDGPVVGEPEDALATRQRRWIAVRWSVWTLALHPRDHYQLAYDQRRALTHTVLVSLIEWIDNPLGAVGLSMPIVRELLAAVPLRAGAPPIDAWSHVEPSIAAINLAIGRDMRTRRVGDDLPADWEHLAARLSWNMTADRLPVDFEINLIRHL